MRFIVKILKLFVHIKKKLIEEIYFLRVSANSFIRRCEFESDYYQERKDRERKKSRNSVQIDRLFLSGRTGPEATDSEKPNSHDK